MNPGLTSHCTETTYIANILNQPIYYSTALQLYNRTSSFTRLSTMSGNSKHIYLLTNQCFHQNMIKLCWLKGSYAHYWQHVKYRICYMILHGMFYQVSYGIILLLTPKVVHVSTNTAGNLQTFNLLKPITLLSISQYFSVPHKHTFKKLLIFIRL